MSTNVGELQVVIGADISKLEAGVKKAVYGIADFSKNVTGNINAINTAFAKTQRSINLAESMLQRFGITPSREALSTVKRALRDIENEEKRHTRELTNQYKERQRAATNAGIFGGLTGGITVGGRLGFAGGYFSSRLGTGIGASLGAAAGRGIGKFFGGDLGEEIGGRKGGASGGFLGGVIGFSAIMPVIAVAQKAFQGIQLLVEKIWEGMKAVANVTWQAVKAAFNLGLEYEKSVITFQILLGSEEKGKKLYEDIEKFAVKSPYRTSKLIGPAQTLLGAGVSEENVMPVLKRIGDIAGGDYDRMNRLMKAFTDVMAKGILQGEERRQFGNVGIGLKDFAETINVSTAKFQKMMRAGEISSNVVIETINRLTSQGGRFNNLSTNVATKTVGGALEAIQETFEQFGSRLARSFFEKFRVGEILRKFLNIFENFDTSVIDQWIDRAQKGLSRLGKFFNVDFIKEGLEGFFARIHDVLPTWEQVGKTIEDGLKRWIPSLVEGFKLAATAGISFVEVLVKVANATGAVIAGMVKWIPGIETHTNQDALKHKQRMLLYEQDPDKDFIKFKDKWMWEQRNAAGEGFDPNDKMVRLNLISAYKKSLEAPKGFNIDELKKGMPGADTVLETLKTAKDFINNIPAVDKNKLQFFGKIDNQPVDNTNKILKFTEDEKKLNKQINESFIRESSIVSAKARERIKTVIESNNSQEILLNLKIKDNDELLKNHFDKNQIDFLEQTGVTRNVDIDKLRKEYDKVQAELGQVHEDISNRRKFLKIDVLAKREKFGSKNTFEDDFGSAYDNDPVIQKLISNKEKVLEKSNSIFEKLDEDMIRIIKEELKNPNSKFIKGIFSQDEKIPFINQQLFGNAEGRVNTPEFKNLEKQQQFEQQKRKIIAESLKTTQATKKQLEEENGKIKTVQTQLPLEVRNIIEDLEKQSLKGFTDFDRYTNYEKNLRIGRFGQNGIAGELSDEEYSQGLVSNFNNLAKTLDKVGDRLPQTQYYGSSEAQATINNSILQNQTKDIQQQILNVLTQAKAEAAQQTELNRQMAAALKKIAGGDPLEDALDFMFN